MTSLKHYHLGCGESLQSHCEELRKLMTTKFIAEFKSGLKPAVSSKKVKQH